MNKDRVSLSMDNWRKLNRQTVDSMIPHMVEELLAPNPLADLLMKNWKPSTRWQRLRWRFIKAPARQVRNAWMVLIGKAQIGDEWD